MRNFTKILCVVLALVVALSAASCSLSKQYSYKEGDVELPIGLYIYYLRRAYNEAQSYAQKDTEKYDSEKGTYDGSKSFLKMEITDDEGKTAVAEDWIKDKAAAYMNEAIGVFAEYNRLGCTVDEAQITEAKKEYKDAWDNGYEYYGYAQPALSKTFEPLGIGVDSLILADVQIPMMKTSVFKAEYKDVADDELKKFYEENYTSYHYFTADLYTSQTDDSNNTTYNPVSAAQKAAYETAFNGYADAINGGAKFSEQLDQYKEAYDSNATATENKEKIDPDTTDEIKKAILGLKEGEAKQIIVGESGKTPRICLIYKEPIADTVESYFKDDVRDSVISVMKEDDFKALLQKAAESTDGMSSACKSYKPSLFEA